MGMIGGQQMVSLNNGGCVYAGTIAHELIHALGMSRQKRDTNKNEILKLTKKKL